MASAKEAKEWAPERLRGLVDALFTPFCGKDGDEIDYDTLRRLARYCLVDLKHDGLYACGTVNEFWALTKEERKKIAEVAINEARKINRNAICVVHTGCLPVKDCVELTNHAKEIGADAAVMLNPYFEAWGASGVYKYYKYIADRTDIPIVLYNHPASGFILTPEEIADLYNRIPAICAVKNVAFDPKHTITLHGLVPKMVIWHCNTYQAGIGGLMKYGYSAPVILGGLNWIEEKPGKMLRTEHWKLLMEGKLTEAAEHWFTSGLAVIELGHREIYTVAPGRPGYLGHWGSAAKYMGSLLGVPVGDYPHSRPPQSPLPEALKQKCRDMYIKAGFLES